MQSQPKPNGSFSQSKPSTREERKEWEKLMDNLVDDERMLPPKTAKLSASNKVEAWVTENERLAASQR